MRQVITKARLKERVTELVVAACDALARRHRVEVEVVDADEVVRAVGLKIGKTTTTVGARRETVVTRVAVRAPVTHYARRAGLPRPQAE